MRRAALLITLVYGADPESQGEERGLKKNMKKILLTALLMITVGTVGCGAKADKDVAIIGGADGPTSVFLASNTEEGEITDDPALAITGTWQTASIGYMDGDDMQPEYYVQFTSTQIVYGHMTNGSFTPEFSDKIFDSEELASGGYMIKAINSSGIKYTYLTSESDDTILEYYETWDEFDYADKYFGGSSLSKCE